MANLDQDLIAQIRTVLAKELAQEGEPPSAGPDDDGPTDDGSGGDQVVGEGEDAAQDVATGNEAQAEAKTSPLEAAHQAFLKKWSSRTEGLELPLRLVANQAENDFSGALVADDDYYVKEFLEDLGQLLAAAGKAKTDDALSRAHLEPFATACVEKLRLSMNERNVIPTKRLIALDMLDQYPPEGADAKSVGLFMRTLGTLADDRYLMLVGSENEVWDLIRRYPVLEPTIGEHVIRLRGMDAAETYDAYVSFLDERLRAKADDDFRRRFLDYVEFNGSVRGMYGRDLADYLAKQANATGELSLPIDRYNSVSLEDMLAQVVGLEQVKQTVRRLESYAVYLKRAEGHGCKLPSSNMHMVFLGNPGTGKTMMARLIANMLHKIGVIRTSRFVEVSSKDLIGKYVGHTDKQVHEKVVEALGGVLFVDEAYALMPQGEHSAGFGDEAIAELVKCMEDYKDDLVVILAGYEKEMQGLIDSNPGIASRVAYTFHFDDYTVDELVKIFHMGADSAGLEVEARADAALRQLFAYFSRFKSFGNGRFVGEVLQRAIIAHAVRMGEATANTSEGYFTLGEEDIPSRRDMFDVADAPLASVCDMLEPLVGLDTVKESIVQLEKTVTYRERALKAGIRVPDINLNMVFRGRPGTGKTTVARIIGTMLYNIGAVPRSHFEEVEARDLLGSTMDDTASVTKKAVERAMGGVLFVDEAYALLYDARGREALAVLVKAMEDHKGEFSAMFAGYPDEMRDFINENPGLASRIGYTFDFEDYEADDLLEIFKRKMGAYGYGLGDGVEERVRDVFRYFHSVENYGNGRFVDRLIQELIVQHAGDCADDTLSIISKEDVPTIKHMCDLSATEVTDCTGEEEDAALRRVAIHESGHAVCRLLTTGKTDIVRITIEHEGNGALGYVQHERGRSMLPTSADYLNELVCLLGGMAAEDYYLGSFSGGNSSDLEMATKLAMRYVGMYGMSEAGLVQYVSHAGTRASDPSQLPKEVREAMRKVLDGCLAEAKRVIEACRPAIDALVEALNEKGTLTGEELMEVWERHRP